MAGGFLDEDAILTGAVDYFEGEIDAAVVRREAPRLLCEALSEQAPAARDWPDWTDCDRLDAAFAALEADGIVSRQNFTCCGTCGSAEIRDKINAATDAGLPARGYAFFHVQDTESAVEGYGLYLNYGACAGGEAAAVGIGREIVAAFEEQGLETEWDGSLGRRIEVALEWQKRRAILR